MRRIAHISDLHFGAEEPGVADGLLDDVHRHAPDLIAVSGDLTQRARASQFRAARRFLDRLRPPKLVVPGNHDIPLYNVAARFCWPLTGYRRHIGENLEPDFVDEELAAAGVNTARSNTWKDGRLSTEQIERLRAFFTSQQPEAFKLLVAHHPFVPPHDDPEAALVGGAPQALKMLEACGCHLILAGHLHRAYAGDVRPHHVEIKRSILVVQAGTAISHRRREEPNAYNLFTVNGPQLRLEVRAWNGRNFSEAGLSEYCYDETGWRLLKSTGVLSAR